MKDTKRFELHLSNELFTKLKNIAKAKEITLSALCRLFLEEQIYNEEKCK